jgi:enterochelin esterase-like enzyme
VKNNRPFLLLLAFVCASALAQQKPSGPPGALYEPQIPPPTNNYPLTPDSRPHPGVAKGVELQFPLNDAKVFPATQRIIHVYVPAEYTGTQPACVFVFLDKIAFQAATVFDNLIAAHQMPITIAVGIGPGLVPSADGGTDPRFDRSFEFDNRTGRLARFILDEVLPAVERQKTPDGHAIRLSTNPDDRAIGGGSTGAIAAFNVAWQRPDAFHRVFTSIGTFVGMRGGEQLYVQVRKTEPKPIRIFMTDGANDGWPGGLEMGDWFMSNVTMERALSYAGYDVHHVWGQGTHNGALAGQVFPEAVRWLFRDYPAPISAQPPNNQKLKPLLIEGEGWKPAPTACAQATSLAGDSSGGLHFAGVASCAAESLSPLLAIGPDGKSYTVHADGHTIAAGTTAVDADAPVTALALSSNGDLYVATRSAGEAGSDLWRFQPNGAKLKLASTPHAVSSLAFLPDGQWLFAAQPDSHLSYSFRVLADGGLDAGEPFYDLYPPADADGSGARSVAFDSEGHAYVATTIGVQICDRNGRVIGILPLPENAPAQALAFGGEGFHTLFVLSQGKLYARQLKATGVYPGAAPIVLPKFGAG